MKIDRIIQSNEEGKNEENEEVLKKIQNSTKWSSISEWAQQKEKREKEAEKLIQEKIAENFPNLKKNINLYTREAQKTLLNTKRSTYRHIIVKLLKNKEKLLEVENKQAHNHHPPGKKTHHTKLWKPNTIRI